MSKISAVIITLNEEKNIARCLQSLEEVVDEIVVVDEFSQDQTVSICEQLGAKVIQKEWQGFAANKNFGNQQAANDFILSIDSDEALSEQLKNSIRSVKPNLEGAYSFNRLTNYCGKWIYHSGWYPDPKIRLFNKHQARWEGAFVHESLVLAEGTPLTHLQGDLYHYSFSSLSDHIRRLDKYSDLAAQEIIAQKKQAGWSNLVFSPSIKFLKVYFLKMGFMDGFYGFSISVISAFDVFLRYAKVRRLNMRNEGE